MNVGSLVGAGDRIGRVVLPVAVGGLVLNVVFPEAFTVGGPPWWLAAISWVILLVGVVVWGWSVVLIVTRAPRGELITSGPFAVVRHPLYTGVALLVLPWVGFLLDSWLGAVLGAVLYLAARRYEPAEEAELASRFGPEWEDYRGNVLLPHV